MKNLFPRRDTIVNSSNPDQSLDNRTPLDLGQKEKIWTITQGEVHVFVLLSSEKNSNPSRIYVCSLQEGNLLFSLETQNSDFRFIAVGTQGTLIKQLEVSALIENFPNYGIEVKQWFEKLLTGFHEDKKQELQESLLPDSLLSSLENNDSLSMKDLAQIQTENLKYVDILTENCTKKNEYENQRVIDREEIEKKSFSQTLCGISEMIDGKTRGFTTKEKKKQTQLLADAFEKILRDLKMDRAQYKVHPDLSGVSGLEALCRTYNIRQRMVLLREKWWVEDNGTLMAFLEDENEALIPVVLKLKGQRYILWDSRTQKECKVDGKIAESINPKAFHIYRNFSDKAVKLKDLVKFAGLGSFKDLLTYFSAGLLGALLGLLVPKITQVFFDQIIPQAALNQMMQLSALLIISALLIALLELIKGFTMIRLETVADYSIQAAVWDRLLKLPATFFKKYSAGDLADRSLSITAIRQILSGSAIVGIMNFIFSCIYIFIMFHYSKDLSKTGLLLCLISVAVTGILGYAQYKSSRESIQIKGHLSGMLLQLVSGISKLVIASAEVKTFGEWAKIFIKKRSYDYKTRIKQNLHKTFLAFSPIVMTMILFFKYTKSGDGSLSIGSFLAFLTAFNILLDSLSGMAGIIINSLKVIPLYKRVRPILETTPEVIESKKKTGKVQGKIDISHINFRYDPDGPLILKDISISINSNQYIALVGSSGSGKSTLLRLLLGFEKPESGTIYYDHMDMESLEISSLRQQLGVVLQDSKVTRGSLFKNIIGNSSTLTMNDAWNAAEKVGLADDIREMPMGMHTEVPAGGGTLSGGQRQRVVIARAIVHNPKILFFDEATSALDNKTQAIVTQSLDNLGVTRVIIAHRLSTIVNADLIYYLHEGEILESGTYNDLIKLKGYFYQSVQRQQV